MVRKALGGILALVLACAVVFTFNPAWFGPLASIARDFPGAYVVAMRGAVAVAFLGGAVIFALIGAVRRGFFGRGGLCVFLALVLLGGALAHALVIFDRGYSAVRFGSEAVLDAAAPGSLTTLQYNTEGGKVPVEAMANLIENNGVRAVALSETSTSYGVELVEELSRRGLAFQKFDHDVSRYQSDWRSTVLLVSAELGEYKQFGVAGADGADVPYIVGAAPAAGASAEAPEFIAVHPIAPVREFIDQWRANTALSYSLCASHPHAIVLGDFNSTADHESAGGFNACKDAGSEARVAGTGTWPTNIPAVLASPIDRVLTGSDNWTGTEGAIVDAGGSDHRGILVRLAPVAR